MQQILRGGENASSSCCLSRKWLAIRDSPHTVSSRWREHTRILATAMAPWRCCALLALVALAAAKVYETDDAVIIDLERKYTNLFFTIYLVLTFKYTYLLI